MAKLEFGWRMATFSTDGSPGTQVRDHVAEHLRRLEGHVDTVWVQDHLMPEAPWTQPTWDSFECWSTLAHWAGAFPAYRYGTIVLANSFRSPALLAKMAATTQTLTNGRLILGLGAGWHEGEYKAYGFPYPSPATRIRQLEEAVQVIRAMWTQTPASFSGKHYQIENAYCEPKPDPMPPIMIGAAGEQLALRVVAKYADWYNTPGSPFEVVQRKLDVLRQHCDEIGRDYKGMVKTGTVSAVAVASTRAEAQRMVEASPFYKADQPSAAVVGEPGDCVEQLRRFADLGVTHLNIRFADFPRLDGAMRFFEEVVPLLRAAGL
jgi:alkanesulfonate monooxygenase SsuD/methylene tetrahydromethanopterin reductase-like flavin-dependent oxidoreductase (luciferase family)